MSVEISLPAPVSTLSSLQDLFTSPFIQSLQSSISGSIQVGRPYISSVSVNIPSLTFTEYNSTFQSTVFGYRSSYEFVSQDELRIPMKFEPIFSLYSTGITRTIGNKITISPTASMPVFQTSTGYFTLRVFVP